MAKNSGKSKAKKNAKSNGLVTNSNNNKKKMYPEISTVCDFFCRYLVDSNMFNLEQILNFKTNLRTILTKKYKQYTWDKRHPLKGNACRSILVLKSTFDPVLIVAAYKAGFLKMDEEDVNTKSKEDQQIISHLNTSINNFTNVITITPPPELDDDSSIESSSPNRLSFIDNSPGLTAIKTNTLEKGQSISYEVFKNIFLKKGEFVLWCDPGSVSYSLDDGQIITLYDREKEKMEHKKNSGNKNHKVNSPNNKISSSHSPALSVSPNLSRSESSSTIDKRSPLVLPVAAVSKKDKKKNKRKERKEAINNASSQLNSPSSKSKNSINVNKKINTSKVQQNHATVNDILKNVDLDDPIMLPPSYNNENQNLSSMNSKHLSMTSIPTSYSNGILVNSGSTNSKSKFFNSLNREIKNDDNISFSPELNGKKLNNRRESLLSAIPNNNEMVNSVMNAKSRKNSLNNNYNKIISTMAQATSATTNITEKTHPFIGLLSRSAVIV